PSPCIPHIPSICLISYRFRPHRYLHSFPTRRSSDLISSTHMKITMALRRSSTPKTPRVKSAADTPRAGPSSIQSLRLARTTAPRSEEHSSELQSPDHLVCRLLLEKKKKRKDTSMKAQ